LAMSGTDRVTVRAFAGLMAVGLLGWVLPAAAPARADGPPAGFLVQRLSLDQFKTTIFDLAALETRYWNKPGNTTARDYIRTKLESYGYTVTLDPYTYLGQTKHNVYATRIGTAHATQMYIVGAHFDSFNIHGDYDHCPGADDDGSGVAAVLECARVFARARPDLSVRFILWNNEETGLNGSAAYVARHRTLQGTPDEPNWTGMIQLDMICYDHGPDPVPDANIEYNAAHGANGSALVLAQALFGAMATYGSIPAVIGNNMNYTDSVSFWNATAAVSIRENERISQIGQGSNPNWHQPTDLYDTYSETDYEFGFQLLKMLTGGVGELTGAVPLGDGNCDQQLDFNDILPFATALNGEAAYHAAYPNCDWLHADCNGDGTVDANDILPFVRLLTTP
jgi:hypothetical protein